MDIIRVRPAPSLRREFATWAVAQQPKIRTLSTDTFAVPVGAYVDAPESILIGAVVDDHPYVPVADTVGDPEPPQVGPESEAGLPAAPTGDVLLGVATAEAFTPPPVAEVAEQGGEQQTAPAPPAPAAVVEPAPRINCPDCDRPFTSKRGLRAHRRQVHGEGATSAR